MIAVLVYGYGYRVRVRIMYRVSSVIRSSSDIARWKSLGRHPQGNVVYPSSPLRSAKNTGTRGTRSFSVAGPTVWNSLLDHLRDPAVDSKQFRRDLFVGHSKLERVRSVYVIVLYKSTFDD